MDSSNGTAKKFLTADEIFAAKDIEEIEVEVPQWGGFVKIRTLSQKQSAELRKRAMRTNPTTKVTEMDNEALEALLFIEGVVEPKFTMADYGKIIDKSMSAVTIVLRAIMDASGFSSEAVSEATKSPVEGSGAALRIPSSQDLGDDPG